MYLEYLDDTDLFSAIDSLYSTYTKSFASKTLAGLNKNIMDPFKFQFDTVFLNHGDIERTLSSEIFRQSDKSISNAIGVFHQQLLGAIYGFCETPDLPCDVKKEDGTIFAEIKNKHNTMNVRSAAGVFEELEGLAKSNPKAICYLVEIIAKKSSDEVWIQTVNEKKLSHPRIRKISADMFYAVATGDENAFKKLCEILPAAVSEYLEKKQSGDRLEEKKISCAYEELVEKAAKHNRSVLEEMFKISFSEYDGF